jgi:endogenous inhibitor of DNA gyrase (YacG/DUF329 family)
MAKMTLQQITRAYTPADDTSPEPLHFHCKVCGDKVFCRADDDDYYPYCSPSHERLDLAEAAGRSTHGGL